MRRRLVAAFVGLAVLVIVVFGLLRTFVILERVEAQEQELLDRSADAAQVVAEQAAEDGEPVTAGMLAGLVREGEKLEYRPPGGPVVVVQSGAPAPDDARTTVRTLEDGSTLTLSVSPGEFRDEVMDVLVPLLLMSLGLIVFAGAAGWLLARRLARPFTELAGVAESFGRGRLDTEVPRYAMPEADAIARALEESAQSLQRMLRREREVSDYASHDLRTPITALRLTLEDLLQWPSTAPDVAEELNRILTEVDRFSSAVSTLVDAPTVGRPAQLVDVAAVLREAARGRPDPRDGNRIDVHADAPVLVRLPVRLVVRALDLLVEHAAVSSEGSVRGTVADSDGYVVVELQARSRVPEGDRDVVWDQAGGVAAELGGRLGSTGLDDGRTSWTLTLPKGHAPSVGDVDQGNLGI